MQVTGIKVKGYKSFSEEYAEMDSFENINIFIGRNNSGKSSCLDMIECITDAEVYKARELSKECDIQVRCKLSESDVRAVFPDNVSGGGIKARNHFEFGRNYIGEEMWFQLGVELSNYDYENEKFKYSYVQSDEKFSKKYIGYWKNFEKRKVKGFSECEIRRINAERNIVPEVELDHERISDTGDGASNLVRKFLNYSNYDENLIQKKLLNALNAIVKPDAEFNNIKIQQVEGIGDIEWEIFLEDNDIRYALSKMGSGLKTIILVLLNLLVIPETDAYKNKKIIYLFEELENNLHPALQRRLYDYLYDYSIRNDVIFFITTHSHIAINAFSDKEKTRIYHIKKENGSSTLHKIDDFISKSALLNDLDVKAADLLQSNGVIWVEGPSDKVYIKKWLEIFCGNRWKEGRDYQFLYYGGRLLSHYTANPEQEVEELINILLTNRNAAIVMDSDKRYQSHQINETKKRVRKEFEKNNAFCWITQGKEIENYLPKRALEEAYSITLDKQCGRYELFSEYIKKALVNFVKVPFSHYVCKYITKDNSVDMLDLKKQIDRLDKCIESWNK